MSRPTSTNSTFAQYDISDRLEELFKKTGYPIVQENGQRKYGPPSDWQGDDPPRGCEVFIGKLPRNMFEDEIVPIFEKVGKLYQFRLMMDFSGTNRGFAFARYTNKSDARKAIAQLDNYEIRKNQHIGVVMSVDNCRLYLGRIPRNKTCEEVHEEICKLTEDVVKVILYPNTDDRSKNRGFAFVEYATHQAATAARRKLIPVQVTMWNNIVEVDWAEPEQEPDEDVIAQVKNLYVRNLMPSTTESELKELFENITGKDTIEHVKKQKDYAFVHFKEKHFAALALQTTNGLPFQGSQIEVVWAKPVDRNLKRLKNMASNNQHYFHAQSSPAIFTQLTPNAAIAAASPFGPYSMPASPQQMLLSGLSTAQVNNVATGAIISPCANIFNGNSSLSSHATTNSLNVPSLNASFAHFAGSPTAMPYAGLPFIDPSAGGLSQGQNHQWARLMNKPNRSAAGMRSAGFQTAANNAASNRSRRKFTENTKVNDSCNSVLTSAGSCGLILLPQPVVSFSAPPALSVTPLPLVNAVAFRPNIPVVAPQDQDNTNGHISPPGQPDQRATPGKGYCQLLEDYCSAEKFEQPDYQLTTITSKDVMGNDLPMYVYKVIIPNLVGNYGDFERRVLFANADEAKEQAAQFALIALGYPFRQQDQANQQHAAATQMILPTSIANNFQTPPPNYPVNYPASHQSMANFSFQRFSMIYQPSPSIIQQNTRTSPFAPNTF